MNRRLIVAAVAVLAIAVLGGGVLIYQRSEGDSPRLTKVDAQAALVRPHSPILGPENARVTIVEFFDPACEACRVFHPIIKQFVRQFAGEVRVVLRYAAFHAPSEQAIRILETARRQGLFEEVLDILFRNQPRWASHSEPTLDEAWRLAEEAGLDVARARQDMQLPEISEPLTRDAIDIQALGIRQTPTIFINGTPLDSYNLQAFYDQVRAEVETGDGTAAQ